MTDKLKIILILITLGCFVLFFFLRKRGLRFQLSFVEYPGSTQRAEDKKEYRWLGL